jgi:phosphoglycolate phosphatase
VLNIDSIFFDIDGTLLDARKDIVNALNYALAEMGLPQKSFDEIVSYIGTGVSDLVEKSVGNNDKALVQRGVELYGDYYVKHPADSAKLYPHAEEILEYFKNKQKFILTNRYAKFADVVLRSLGIREYFKDIVGGDDENCIKPSACVLDPVIAKFNIEKSKAIIVGDMTIDIMTGNNAGIKTCWIKHGLGKAEEVKPLRPSFIIDDLLELKNIIL